MKKSKIHRFIVVTFYNDNAVPTILTHSGHESLNGNLMHDIYSFQKVIAATNRAERIFHNFRESMNIQKICVYNINNADIARIYNGKSIDTLHDKILYEIK